MESFYQTVLNIASKYIDNNPIVRVIGNGDIHLDFLNTYSDNTVDIVINGCAGRYIPNSSFTINIVKNKKYFQYNKTDKNSINLISYDIYENNENSIVVPQEICHSFNNDFSLILNPIIFSFEIGRKFNPKLFITDGYSFTSDIKIESLNSKEYNNEYFENQKHEYNNYLTNFNLQIIDYNKFSLNSKRSSIKNVINNKIKNKEPIIVAELTNNHFGSYDSLIEMTEKSIEQGADLIKIQKRNVDTFCNKPSDNELMDFFDKKISKYSFRKLCELDEEKLNKFNDYCNNNNVPWFCSVLDQISFDIINKFDPQLIKIPSTISEHKNYIKYVSENYKNDIVISTGATTQEYIDEIIKLFYNNNKKIFLLHTASCYPTPEEDINIGIISNYKDLSVKYPNIIPGYSGHDIGNLGGFLAVVAGALMLEKHVTLKKHGIYFDSVALELNNNELRNYVNEIKKAKIYMGDYQKKIYSFEHHKY